MVIGFYGWNIGLLEFGRRNGKWIGGLDLAGGWEVKEVGYRNFGRRRRF
jgi:hypothetical protein